MQLKKDPNLLGGGGVGAYAASQITLLNSKRLYKTKFPIFTPAGRASDYMTAPALRFKSRLVSDALALVGPTG